MRTGTRGEGRSAGRRPAYRLHIPEEYSRYGSKVLAINLADKRQPLDATCHAHRPMPSPPSQHSQPRRRHGTTNRLPTSGRPDTRTARPKVDADDDIEPRKPLQHHAGFATPSAESEDGDGADHPDDADDVRSLVTASNVCTRDALVPKRMRGEPPVAVTWTCTPSTALPTRERGKSAGCSRQRHRGS